jgi:hypothetical protein
MSKQTMIEKYEAKLKAIPAPGGAGCHVALLGVADSGVMAGVNENQIFKDIQANIPNGGRKVPDREIQSAIKTAVLRFGGNQSVQFMPPVPKPKRDVDGSKRFLQIVNQFAGVQEVDLWEASPMRLDEEPGPWDAITALSELYKPDDILFVGDVYQRNVFTVTDHIAAIKSGIKTEAHIIPNPMTGAIGKTKDGSESFRCDATIADFRFAIVEFDNATRNQQVCFWYSMIAKKVFNIAALIDSGGKSIHAWVRVNLKTEADWDKYVRGEIYDQDRGLMAIMGADRSCQNPSRLSRLPGHYRKEKNAWQRLLYLNP